MGLLPCDPLANPFDVTCQPRTLFQGSLTPSPYDDVLWPLPALSCALPIGERSGDLLRLGCSGLFLYSVGVRSALGVVLVITLHDLLSYEPLSRYTIPCVSLESSTPR